VRVGTSGFVGARLREARDVRGQTAIGLAELTGLSRQAISQYENGRATPSPAVLHDLAACLNVPPEFFTRAERSLPRGTMFYRSMASTTKAARLRAEGRFAWLRDIAGYVENFVALPASNFPQLDVPEDPRLLSSADIEAAADAVRRYWGMRDTPIGNIVNLLENQGAITARDELGADTLDGLSEFAPDSGRPFVIIATDKGTPVRWRFDAAHELGHIVLHSRLKPDLLTRPAEFKLIEDQAHRFAGAFLLPSSAFTEEFFAASLDAFRPLKLKWKVSIGVLIKRARHTDLISEQTERRLWMNYARRGWRTSEPYDDQMEPELPRLLRRAFELLFESGARSPEDVVAALALPSRDIERLAGLEPGFMGSDFAPVSLIGTRPSRPDRADTERSLGEVIQLPLRPRTR
jgi:Zn-dependent peptidase ImmA (M78 family)/transcriptional regulator with XRE-family HTH domain